MEKTTPIYQQLKSLLDEDGRLHDTTKHIDGLQLGLDVRGLTPVGHDALWYPKELNPQSRAVVDELSRFLKAIAKGQTKHLDAVRQTLKRTPIVTGILEHIPRSFMGTVVSDDRHLLNVARILAYRDTDARCVKLGIILLGMLGITEDWEKVRILAMHEEFTYYACFCITAFTDQPAKTLWELAKDVYANGRVAAVLTLVRYPLTREIKDWLATRGYELMNGSGELAIPCAVHGELEQRLTDPQDGSTDWVFQTAQILNLALVDEHNQNDLRAYMGFPSMDLLTHFVSLSRLRPDPSFHSCLAMYRILDFLRRELETQAPDKPSIPLDPALDLMKTITDYLDSPSGKWDETLRAGLALPVRGTYFRWALEAAERRGWDGWGFLYATVRTEQSPEPEVWRLLADRADRSNLRDLIAFARLELGSLPLPHHAPSPSIDVGGPESAPELCWVEIVLALGRYPGEVEELLQEALSSSGVFVQLAALVVLMDWAKAALPLSPSLREAVSHLRRTARLPQFKSLADRILD